MAKQAIAKKCAACPVVTNAIEEHHVVPLSYGGKQSGRTVAICGNCHTVVHRCIENVSIPVPRSLARVVAVGRRAKEMFEQGKLEARDRRPTLLVAMDSEHEAYLAQCQTMFNTKSRSATVLAALRFASAYGRRVQPNG